MYVTCTADTLADNNGDTINVDMELMTELTSNEPVTSALSPTLLDFDPLTDSCTHDGFVLETDDVLPDLSSLEDFVDLREFFVSWTVCTQHFCLI